MASPRVLTLTFEFHVPEGLRANSAASDSTGRLSASPAQSRRSPPRSFRGPIA
jgi:hypothetical protein